MLGLSANLNCYLFNGSVDMRKGIFRLCEHIRSELKKDPSDTTSVYMSMSKNRRIVKLLHYEHGFYVGSAYLLQAILLIFNCLQ